MSAFRNKLIDEMISVYGFEHNLVIEFTRLCETYPETKAYNDALNILVISHQQYPQFE